MPNRKLREADVVQSGGIWDRFHERSRLDGSEHRRCKRSDRYCGCIGLQQ